MDVEKLRAEETDKHHLIPTVDNQTLFLREWSPDQESDTCVLINHGITAHSKPYSILGVPISRAGITCYGLDLRGHGLSDGIRGDYPSRDILVSDLRTVHDFLKERHSKVIVLGHSLGVVTSGIMLNELQDEIDGIVFLSAARTAREGVQRKPSKITTLKILVSSILKPSKPVIQYYREGMVGTDDPLFNFYYTLRFLRVLSPEKLELPERIDIPVFVGVGENDELFSVNAVESFVDEINAEKKEFHIVPNGKHAVFPDGSWNPLIDWLNNNF
ncbi:MAG: alpha/beta hydrolase [Candidatus Thorarchaeota archaeon]